MIFDNDHPGYTPQGKAKGIWQVLGERGLWREHRADGFIPFALPKRLTIALVVIRG